jgi:hypothetical protein
MPDRPLPPSLLLPLTGQPGIVLAAERLTHEMSYWR